MVEILCKSNILLPLCTLSKLFQNKINIFCLKLDKCMYRVWYKRPINSLIQQVSFSDVHELSKEDDLSKQLINWAITQRVSNSTFSKLLKILAEHGVQNIPKTSHTLLKAREQSIKIISVDPGVYVHYGIENKLKKLIEVLAAKKLIESDEIGLSIFIDNLPLNKDTNTSLWAILGSIDGQRYTTFGIGAYLGQSKPKDSNLFLSALVNELKTLCINGIEINNVLYKVDVSRIICDAPAKCFVLNMKNFSAYSSCTKCSATGNYGYNKIFFPHKSDLRVDADFLNKDLYKGEKTKLLEIPNFGVVSKIPLDYMHLVCLGVTKKLISIWVDEIDEYYFKNYSVKSINKTFPNDFKSKAKDMPKYGFWNALNYRQFLLYYGPILVKDAIPSAKYDHFLLLHVACRILCTADANPGLVELAEKLLNKFIVDLKHLYGEQIVTHNFHGLYHLVDDYRLHGSLDSFSAFQYEDYLSKLKNSIQRSKKKLCLQTVFNTAHDTRFNVNLKKLQNRDGRVKMEIKGDHFVLPNCRYYKNLKVRNSEIELGQTGDVFVSLTNGKIIRVSGILKKKDTKDDIFVVGNEFLNVTDFYKSPVDSSVVNVFQAKELSKEAHIWSVKEISRKCLIVSINAEENIICALLDENY